MLTSAEPFPADTYPRLVWDREQVRTDTDATDAALAARIARAVQSMEELVAIVRQTDCAAGARRGSIELALTRIDEQMMLATRALLALPTESRAVDPLRLR